MTLTHNTTQRKFIYIGEHKPQFTNVIYVKLRNQKTGLIEQFTKDTYLNFFTQNP